jgi:chromosome segregation ATPase
MTITIFLAIVGAIASVIAAITAVAAFVRVGRWRDSDDGKRIDSAIQKLESYTASDDGGPSIKADIHKIKNEITKIDLRLSSAERASDKVNSVEGRITGIETRLQHLASRADIESLKAELGGVQDQIRSTAAGVARIEGYMMESGR